MRLVRMYVDFVDRRLGWFERFCDRVEPYVVNGAVWWCETIYKIIRKVGGVL